MMKTIAKIDQSRGPFWLAPGWLASIVIMLVALSASPASATDITLHSCDGGFPFVGFKTFKNNDALAKDHSFVAIPEHIIEETWDSPQTVSCSTSTCILQMTHSKDDYWFEGTWGTQNLYIKFKDVDEVADISDTGCDAFNLPDAGFVFDTNHSSCIQKVSTGFAVDVHMWDKCVTGNPQSNRQWEYTASDTRIRTVESLSSCLTVDAKIPDGLNKYGQHYSHPEPVSGDKVVLRDCLVINHVQDFEYNVGGKHLIRMVAFPDYCMYRAGSNVGDGIYVDKCDPGNTNSHWDIAWQ